MKDIDPEAPGSRDREMGVGTCDAGKHRTYPWEREEDADGTPLFLNHCSECDHEADGTQPRLVPAELDGGER